MTIDFEEPRTHADLWNGTTDVAWERIKATVRANRLKELAAFPFNVNATDPAALEAAYNDRDMMATLAGREMRAALELAGPSDKKSSGLAHGMDVAAALYEARLATDNPPRPREWLL